jgi:hypothetical protein
MDKLEQLKTEIERLLNSAAPRHDQQCTWEDGYWCGLYKIESFLEELMKPEPESKEYENALNSEALAFLADQGITPNLFADQIIRAVKHGARWQKNRDQEMNDYEESVSVLQESRTEDDGLWLSWSDLWRIDGVVVKNAKKALKSGNSALFHGYCGQRMLIEDLASLIRPNDNTREEI